MNKTWLDRVPFVLKVVILSTLAGVVAHAFTVVATCFDCAFRWGMSSTAAGAVIFVSVVNRSANRAFKETSPMSGTAESEGTAGWKGRGGETGQTERI